MLFLAAKCSGSHDGMRVIYQSLGYPGYRDTGAPCVMTVARVVGKQTVTTARLRSPKMGRIPATLTLGSCILFYVHYKAKAKL